MEAQHAFQVNLNLPQAVKFCFIPPAAVQQGLLEIGGRYCEELWTGKTELE